ncbi:MAG: S4 domain-containing protein, partial [Dehalococcoidia bacterium]|nr:S4 domain-containing protein [Dehalococcoidia bacterium]
AEVEEMRRALAAQSVNPMELKKRLAREIVGQFHDASAVRDAEAHFERVVQRKEAPEEMTTIGFYAMKDKWLSRVMVEARLASSVGEAKRLISQGAVERNGQRITADFLVKDLAAGDVLKVGKHRFARVVG